MMKKIIYIVFALLLGLRVSAQVNNCCPQFNLQQLNSTMACPGDNSCKEQSHNGDTPAGPQLQLVIACKMSTQSYYVFPNLPGFTYSWQLVGGTAPSLSANPLVVTWGSGAQGFIQVIVSDASGTCRDTLTRKVCLLDAPVASFTVSPSLTVCTAQPVTFTNTSAGGISYSWDFGDNTGSTAQNPPPHTYASPGTYTVVLTVSNGSSGGANGGGERCGCTDTATAVIHVVAGSGPTITSSCKKMLCPGDTATYCVSNGCAPYNWSVNGGTIIGSATGPCITVKWDTPPATYPTSVSVTTGCAGSCSNTATLNVPVLYNNIPVAGPSPVCAGTTTSYSLPAMPGTFYNWTLTGGGGGSIVAADSNTNVVNINWTGPAGTAVLTCNYHNPYSGCSGSTTLNIDVRKKFELTGVTPLCTNNTGSYSVVGGGTANWTVSPASGYTIGGSTTGVAGISVNWTTAGSYVVAAVPVTPANYCNASASMNVVVNPTPVLSAIAGSTQICPGSFYTYSVTSSLPGSFSWSAANGTIISTMGANNDSVVIKWLGTGSQVVTVSQMVNGCTGSATLAVSNVPVPTIAGASSVCRDSLANYTASGALPAGSYTWTVVPAAAGTIQGGQGTNSVNILWPGGTSPGSTTANVQVVVCGYPPVNFPVTITTPPNVTVNKSGSLCAGGVTLTVSGSLPCYQWFLNGSPISGANAATYTATTYGYYEVKCPGQCSGYGGVFVPREHIPNVTITADNVLTYCTGTPINVNLLSATHPGCSFLWYKNGVSTGTTTGTLNVTTPGSYFVVVNCGNCKDTSNVLVVDTTNCNPGSGCDFSSILREPVTDAIAKAGPRPASGPDEGTPYYTATLSINPPSNPCNNPTFTANYSFTGVHSLNSGIHWDFGDGTTANTIVPNGTGTTPATPPHAYTSVGTYVVMAWAYVNCPPPPTPHTCLLWDTIHYTVPVAANFNYSVNCDKIYLSNLSTVLSGCTIVSNSWSAAGPGTATFSSPTAASPVLTVSQSGVYNVTLQVTSSCNGCTAQVTIPVTVNLPSATFTVPSPVCTGTPVSFNAPAGGTHYLWDFGDGYTSSLQSPSHSFAAAPPSPTVTLTVTDALGCVSTATQPVSVVTPPALTISGDQLICPGSTATITANGSGFTNYTFYQNGVAVQSGPANSYSTGVAGTFYVVASVGGNCPVTSVQTHVFYKPQPTAHIVGNGTTCLYSGTAYIYLYNSVNDPTWSYSWTAAGNPAVLSTTFDLNTTVNTPGNYSYILAVTNSDGCTARDTFCVVVGQQPQVTITGGSGTLCAGTSHTFTATATPANPNYIYQWSNGVTGPTMTTSQPGMYSVNVTDPATGCIGGGFAGTIQKRPSAILFPAGCDTLCDYDSIIPPLALAPGQDYSMYNIQWLLNNVPFYTGPVLNLQSQMSQLNYGVNNISIVVTYNGCSDTSGVYNLFIKKCGGCSCADSHWNELYWYYNSDDPKNPVKKKFECGKDFGVLDCNKPITFFASYQCNPDSCNQAVSYQLTGTVTQSGTMPFSTLGLPAGGYTLTMIGQCGDSTCNRCVIKFKIDCKDCDCKGSKWGTISLTQVPTDVTLPGSKAVIGHPQLGVDLKCGKTYEIKCNTTYNVAASYICAKPNCTGSVNYVLTTPSGTSSGTAPFNFTPTASGVYTLTLYGYCGNQLCDSCVIRFKVDCGTTPPPPCCIYTIGVKDPSVQLTTLADPAATVAAADFGISGPAGNLFTEIRAEVVGFDLSSNFNNECLSCKTKPYAWSSIYQPGPVASIAPQVSLFGGTSAPAFNPAGTGVYQNPREVIWNNGGGAFALPSSIHLSFLLPPASIITCCDLTAKICVKFTFRDKDCRECTSIVCFTVIIKPGSTGVTK